MRAIALDHFGGLDSLVIKEIPEPRAGTWQSRYSGQGIWDQSRRDAHASRRMG